MVAMPAAAAPGNPNRSLRNFCNTYSVTAPNDNKSKYLKKRTITFL
jgi:hypothetical protein